MTSLRARLLLVRSSSLLSLASLIAFVVLGLAPVILVEVVTQRGPFVPWLVIGAMTTAASLLVLVLCAEALARCVRRPLLNAVLTLAAIAVSAAVKVLLVLTVVKHSGFAGVVDIAQRESPVGRLVTNVLISVVILGVACALVSSYRDHRVLRDRLAAERQRLISMSETTLDQMRVAEEALRQEARHAMDPALAAIRVELESTAREDSAERALNGLDEAVRTIVRPMSVRFATSVSEGSDPGVDVAAIVSPRRLRQPVDAPLAVRPWLTTMVLAGAGLLVGVFWRLPGSWFVFLAETAVVSLVVLLAIRWGWPSRYRRMPTYRALVVLAALYSVLFMGTQVAFGIDDLGDVTLDVTWLAVTYRVSLALVISGLTLVQQQRVETDAALAQVNAKLRTQMSRLRRENWAIGRRMSLVMHGSVQSALISAMLLLRDDPSPGTRQEVLVRLEQARVALDAEAWSPGMLEHGLREIASLWSGLCTVEVRLDPHSALQIESEPGLSSCCVEVVRESVSNAVRHGRASIVEVSLLWQDDASVCITVRDDGGSPGVDPRIGLGTRMLDEICLSWCRDQTQTGTKLTAVLV